MNAWDNRSDAERPAVPGPHQHQHRQAGQFGRNRLAIIVSAAVAAVLLVGGGAAAVTLKHGHGSSSAGLSSALSALSASPSVTAVADVTPPVAASSCTRPTAFSYSGTLSASVRGTVTYQWVYSSGRLGPVQSVWFAHPGHKVVAGRTIAPRRAGGGWAELKVLTPVGATSNQAAYQLLCGSGAKGGIKAVAAVTPATQTAACTSAPPDFTANGAIRAAKAETVTYYWAQSDGTDSAPATLTFHHAGTKTVAPLTITPAAASGAGEAVLVVTSPVTAASRPAAYTLNCKALPTAPGGSTPTAPGGSAPGDPTAPAAGPSDPAGSPTDSPTSDPSDTSSSPSGSPSTPTTGPSTSSSSPSTPTSSPSCPAGWIVACTPASSQPSSSPTASSSKLQVDVDSTLRGVGEGDLYSSSVTASGGSGRYSWTATGLPPGLTTTPVGTALDISGVPTAEGPFNVTLTVTDTMSPGLTGTAVLPLWITYPSIRATVNAPSTAVLGQSYSGTVTATGGDGTYNWDTTLSVPGLTLTAHGATLTISGSMEEGGQPLLGILISDGESPAQTWNLVIPITVKAS